MSAKARKARKLPKLWVRLPGALHRKLVRLASHNRRSLNSEIVYRLEHSVRKEGKP
jgi:predicted HicB family RNase H-like nuclease